MLMNVLGLSHDDAHGFEAPLTFSIEEITQTELAELNQDLYDKLFGAGYLTKIEEFKNRLLSNQSKDSQASQ
jgi:trigger factor